QVDPRVDEGRHHLVVHRDDDLGQVAVLVPDDRAAGGALPVLAHRPEARAGALARGLAVLALGERLLAAERRTDEEATHVGRRVRRRAAAVGPAPVLDLDLTLVGALDEAGAEDTAAVLLGVAACEGQPAAELHLLGLAVGLGQLVVVGLLLAQLLGLLGVGVPATPAGPLDPRARAAVLLAVDLVVLLVPVDPPLRGLHVGELVGLVLRVARDAGDVEADRRPADISATDPRAHLDAAQHVDADAPVAELLDERAVAVAPAEEQELDVLALHVPGGLEHAGHVDGVVGPGDAVGQLAGAGSALLAGLGVEVGLPLLLAALGHRVLAAADLDARRRVLVDLLAGR